MTTANDVKPKLIDLKREIDTSQIRASSIYTMKLYIYTQCWSIWTSTGKKVNCDLIFIPYAKIN